MRYNHGTRSRLLMSRTKHLHKDDASPYLLQCHHKLASQARASGRSMCAPTLGETNLTADPAIAFWGLQLLSP